MHTGFWCGELREGDHLEDPGVDGRIILKWIFKKWDEGHGLDWPAFLITPCKRYSFKWNTLYNFDVSEAVCTVVCQTLHMGNVRAQHM
jgi:hypothetical protein